MAEFSIGNYLMQWVTGPPQDNVELRQYLEKFEEAVRVDERENVARFLEKLKLKYNVEFDAYIEHLEGTGERPDQLKLNLDGI
jgi:hypothetical protein